MRSYPNQKVIYIDREMVKMDTNRRFIHCYTDNIFIAASILKYSGFKIYLYLISQMPYTYNSQQRLNAKDYPTSAQPFALSAKALADSDLDLAASTYNDGIKDLEEKGFLVPYEGRYIFYEMPEQYRSITMKEYEEVKDMDIEKALKLIHEQNIAIKKVNFEKRN